MWGPKREQEGAFTLRSTPKREDRPVPRKDSCLAPHSIAGAWTGAVCLLTHIYIKRPSLVWTPNSINLSCTTKSKRTRGRGTVCGCLCLHTKLVNLQMQYKCWQAGWVGLGSGQCSVRMDNGLGWTSCSCLNYKVSSARL